MKHLYDPHMFNYMWESCIAPIDYIVGTYFTSKTWSKTRTLSITWAMVERPLAEGSTSSWMDVRNSPTKCASG